ncbi:hypothetical protein HOG48_06095 [Candidatus Peregrinibacteria bacterium]|jgi:hypothetical protein|nr:hypothetical protein [Candidatus Peregrinibacteria bacterium]
MALTEYNPVDVGGGPRDDITALFPSKPIPEEAKAELQRVLEEQEELGRGNGFNGSTGSSLAVKFTTICNPVRGARISERLFEETFEALKKLERGASEVRDAVCKCLGSERGSKIIPIQTLDEATPDYSRAMKATSDNIYVPRSQEFRMRAGPIDRILTCLKSNSSRNIETGLGLIQDFMDDLRLMMTALLEDVGLAKEGESASILERRKFLGECDKWLPYLTYRDWIKAGGYGKDGEPDLPAPKVCERPRGQEPQRWLFPAHSADDTYNVSASVCPNGTEAEGYDETGFRVEVVAKPGVRVPGAEHRLSRFDAVPAKPDWEFSSRLREPEFIVRHGVRAPGGPWGKVVELKSKPVEKPVGEAPRGRQRR